MHKPRGADEASRGRGRRCAPAGLPRQPPPPPSPSPPARPLRRSRRRCATSPATALCGAEWLSVMLLEVVTPPGPKAALTWSLLCSHPTCAQMPPARSALLRLAPRPRIALHVPLPLLLHLPALLLEKKGECRERERSREQCLPKRWPTHIKSTAREELLAGLGTEWLSVMLLEMVAPPGRGEPCASRGSRARSSGSRSRPGAQGDARQEALRGSLLSHGGSLRAEEAAHSW